MLRRGLIFAVIAVAFDAVCAAIAAAAQFTYSQFYILAIVLFVAIGIYAGRVMVLPRALIAIAIAAVAEATLGWYVAALIGPARPPSDISRTVLIAYGCFGVLVDFAAGAAGAVLGRRAATQR
ncbi:MAG TPA: hypothetical protein VMF61_12090 [Candidatus Acidoferrales bacterium]|nr:hypothetical protein [Candidatus Acidoferrales bacterium]